MVKKEYIVPTLETIELKYEGVLAGSVKEPVENEEDENDPNVQGSNKKNPFNDFKWE